MDSIKPMQISLRMYSRVSGTHEFLENLAASIQIDQIMLQKYTQCMNMY